MELMEAISTNGTCRYYKTDPVPGELVARLLRAAQLGPSGSNRQPVRFLVVREAAKRRGLQALYRPVWEAYLEKARSSDLKLGGQFLTNADHYARHLAEVPVQIVICYGIAEVVPIDAGLDRVSVVGGASIYPMVQNLLLAARAEGLGTTLTTLLCGEAVSQAAETAITCGDQLCRQLWNTAAGSAGSLGTAFTRPARTDRNTGSPGLF